MSWSHSGRSERTVMMPTANQQGLDLLGKVPDDCTIEEVMYQLYVRGRIERGVNAIAAGQVLTQEEVEQRIREKMATWRVSIGPSPHQKQKEIGS